MTAAVESMAYVNEVPWHGLGNALTDGASIDDWKREAGMEWEALQANVLFETADETYYMDDKFVMYRSDNSMPLGVVGSSYKPVQPGEVL